MARPKKSTSKEAFLPLFFGDFLGSTAEWDGEERALYLLLLGYQWTLGSIPADLKKLRKLADYDQGNFERWWPTVSEKFVPKGDDRLLNLRLEMHRAKTLELSQKNSQAGKKGAAAKWRKDGERHDKGMADAIRGDGDRHQSANGEPIANAKNQDGERHKSAITPRHPKNDGATDGNPSHPIPSHPILENPVDISPQIDREVADSLALAAPQNGRERKGSKGKTKPKRSIPDDFDLTPERQTYAETHLPDVDAAALMAIFRSTSKAKDWQYVDWDQHWQTLVRQWAPNSGHWSSGQYPRTGSNATSGRRLTRYEEMQEALKNA